jgi:hypothetical protein
MNTAKRTGFIVLLLLFTLLLSGCVTHRILISFTGEGKAHASYTLEGDSLDVFDARIPHPGNPWALTEHKIEQDSSENLVATYRYETSNVDAISHPVAPLGEIGSLSATHSNHWFYDVHEVTISFPAWHAIERYGDPDSYIPEDIQDLEDSGMDTLLNEQGEDELERIKARGKQLWTVDRYLRQVERLMVVSLGEDADTSAVQDAVARFAPMIRAHVMMLRGDILEPRDPRDISLEWYSELREPMIIAAAEASGLPIEQLAVTLDSLETEYKRWADLQDDTVEYLLVLPKSHFRNIVPEPEETRGDTLIWSVSSETLAEQEFTIIAAGYHIAMLPAILLGLFLGGGVGLIVRRKKRQL